MKTMIKVVGMLAVALLLTASSAKADSVSYQITGPNGFNATFTLPSDTADGHLKNLTKNTSGDDFWIGNVAGTLCSNGSCQAVTFALDFYTNLYGSWNGVDLYSSPTVSGAYNGYFNGAALYDPNGGDPTLFLGTFSLGNYTVTATQVPEPSSLLLLSLGGIAVLALGLKRAG